MFGRRQPETRQVTTAQGDPIDVRLRPEAQDLVLHRRTAGQEFLSSEDPVLAVLMNEQSLLSQRDNILVASSMTIASVGALILGTLLLQLPNPCAVSDAANCIPNNQEWIYFLAPLPIGGLASILVYLSLNSSLNSQMLHKIEREIRLRLNYRIAPDLGRGEGPDDVVHLPSSNTLNAILFSLRSARGLWLYRLGSLLGAGIVITLLLCSMFVVISRLSTGYQVLAIALYTPPALLLGAVFIRGNLPRRRILRDAIRGNNEAESIESSRTSRSRVYLFRPDPVSGRRLIGYLMLPRPTEFLLKALAFVIPILLVRITVAPDWSGWSSALICALLFEFILYQGRYMLNDASDIAFDHLHPRAGARGRIPKFGRHPRAIVRVAAILRIASFFVLLAILTRVKLLSLTTPATNAMLWGALFVLVMTPLYDRSSELTRERLYPSSELEEQTWFASVPGSIVFRRLALVAPGYGVRAAVGLTIAWGYASLGWFSVAAVFAAMSAIEIANVSMGWVLEGAADVSLRNAAYRRSLWRAPHMAWLLRHARVVEQKHCPPPERVDEPVSGDRGPEPVLMTSSGANGPRVWSIAFALALGFACAAGASLVLPSESGWTEIFCCGALGVSAGLIAIVPPPRRSPWRRFANWMSLPAGLAASAAATAYAWSSGAQHLLLVAAFPSLLTGLYVVTKLSNYEDYVHLLDNVRSALGNAVAIAARHIGLAAGVVGGLLLGGDVYQSVKKRLAVDNGNTSSAQNSASSGIPPSASSTGQA